MSFRSHDYSTARENLATNLGINLEDAKLPESVLQYATDATKRERVDVPSLLKQLAESIYRPSSLTRKLAAGEYIVPALSTMAVTARDAVFPDRLIERNASILSEALNNCGRLRERFAADSKDWIEAVTSAEEFLRLEEIHFAEIQAGRYTLPLKEAMHQESGLEKGIARLSAAAGALIESLSKGTLADASINMIAQYAGLLSRDAGNKSVYDAGAGTAAFANELHRQSYRTQIDQLLAEVATLEGALRVQNERTSFLKADALFKVERARASLHCALWKLAHYSQANGPLNYEARLNDTRRQFAQAAQIASSQAASVHRAARSLYGVPVSDPLQAEAFSLDELLVWWQQARLSIERARAMHRSRTVSISIKRSAKGGSSEKGGEFGFDFNLVAGGNLSRPLVRSIQLVTSAGQQSSFPLVDVVLPESSTTIRLCACGSDAKSTQVSPEEVWNLPASGFWSVAPLTPLPENEADIVLIIGFVEARS